MKRFFQSTLGIVSLLAGLGSCSAGASDGIRGIPYPGFVVLAEQRFDPAIQRLLAREELRVLPIHNTRMLLVIPQHQDPRLEEMQIRYLHQLLSELKNSEPSQP